MPLQLLVTGGNPLLIHVVLSLPDARSGGLAGQLVVAQVGLEAQALVDLHGVRAVVLQFVGAQLVEQADNIFSGGFLILSTWETVK